MRKISESFGNPGNGLAQGLSNHYTPIDNIIMNVRNIFGALLGLVVSKGEDGVSLKIQSSNFTNEDTTREILYNSTFDGRTYLANYIMNQGLTGLKIICIGQSCIAYFCPQDLAQDPTIAVACKEMQEGKHQECEMGGNILKENFGEEELEDKTQEELAEIINSSDKVKAAKEFAEKIASVVTLPESMYIKATKDVEGHESIALRYKYIKARPFGGKAETVLSLLNIYSTGKDAVWVDAFLNREMFDEEVISTIESILQFIGAEPTDDECVWTIGNVKDDDDKDDTPEDASKDAEKADDNREVTVEEPKD